ncbi:hypothetical protein ACFV9C_08285 [Kribbella sp. NPDC059898]|uniref:hypothetical protein n=1 Tax=Kribbella sp. NPDC059898 TaxID=3346995 RepID=UPI00365E51F7
MELVDPRPLELDPLLLELDELLLSPELLDVVVPEVLVLECFAETTATETPVAPTPSTAVAIAAADARRNQRGRLGWDSSVLTMPQASAGAFQPRSKRSSSHRQVLLKGL